MRSIHKVITGLCILAFLGLITFLAIVLKPWEEDYCRKIISALNEEKTIAVEDVFSFEFDRAYIFNDPYMPGEALAELYNLDISISEVENGDTDFVQRIVFVDEDGFFVYLFECRQDELLIYEKGSVIYPETIIKKQSLDQNLPMEIYFDSPERYGSKKASEDLAR